MSVHHKGERVSGRSAATTATASVGEHIFQQIAHRQIDAENSDVETTLRHRNVQVTRRWIEIRVVNLQAAVDVRLDEQMMED
jgi:hypothetical protein